MLCLHQSPIFNNLDPILCSINFGRAVVVLYSSGGRINGKLSLFSVSWPLNPDVGSFIFPMEYTTRFSHPVVFTHVFRHHAMGRHGQSINRSAKDLATLINPYISDSDLRFDLRAQRSCLVRCNSVLHFFVLFCRPYTCTRSPISHQPWKSPSHYWPSNLCAWASQHDLRVY